MIPLPDDGPREPLRSRRWQRAVTVLVILLTAALVLSYAAVGLRRPSCSDGRGGTTPASWSWTEARWECTVPAEPGVRV
ncbi:hypothetical protein [Cellulomonas hominis]